MAGMYPFLAVELPGFETLGPGTWTNDHGDVIQTLFFDLVPDLPSPLEEPDRLRQEMAALAAHHGAALIEADVVTLDRLPAFRQIVKAKIPDQPVGQVFSGNYIVPKADCSAVVQVQAVERGITGVREALVLAAVGQQNFFLRHPYLPPGVQGGLPYHVADNADRDAQFPDHPLTRVRLILAGIADTVRLDSEFAARAPFTGPAGRDIKANANGQDSIER